MVNRQFHSGWFAAMCLLAGAHGALALDGRVEISQDKLPLRITNSGSYVVTEDLVGWGGTMISIHASLVTLDLNGHAVIQQVATYAIEAASTADCVTVRNGVIRMPLTKGPSVNLRGKYNRIERVQCAGFDTLGISAGAGSILRGCRVSGGSAGIGPEFVGLRVGDGSMVLDSRVDDSEYGTSDAAGIRCSNGVIVAGCAVEGLASGSWTFNGIWVGDGAVIADSRSDGNSGVGTVTGIRAGEGAVVVRCQAACGDSQDGIVVGGGSVVLDSVIRDPIHGLVAGEGCVIARDTVHNTWYWGVDVGDGSVVRDCVLRDAGLKTADGDLVAKCVLRQSSGSYTLMQLGSGCYALENEVDGWATGIAVTGSHSRVDNNYLTTPTDIDATGASNLIVRNFGNSLFFGGTSNDFAGTIITTVYTNAPWANVDH